jgi:hypothetical protein
VNPPGLRVSFDSFHAQARHAGVIDADYGYLLAAACAPVSVAAAVRAYDENFVGLYGDLSLSLFHSAPSVLPPSLPFGYTSCCLNRRQRLAARTEVA